MLLNDTGIVPHVGCLAVSDAHARMLARAGHTIADRRFVWSLPRCRSPDEAAAIDAVLASDLRPAIEAVDAVVCNGEGTIHHGAGLELLAALGAAQQLGKPTLLVNCVLEEAPGFQRTLERLTDLAVRDAATHAYLAGRGVGSRVAPDSILEAEFSPSPAADLAGRVAVLDWHPQRNHDVGRTLAAYLRDHADSTFYFPLLHGVQRHIWRFAVATLRTASLVVSARHHGIYLAALAGRPFVALPSNTHKVEGLIEASGLPIPVCRTPDELDAAVRFAAGHEALFTEFAAWLRGARPLATFRALPSDRAGTVLDVERELSALEDQTRAHPFALESRFWPLGLIPELAPAAQPER